MSGGSYDYLYCKDIGDLVNSEKMLQTMADDLAFLGYAKDAAKETEEFLLTMRQFINRLETMRERLEPIWYAKEWWASGDQDENYFKEALKKYRGE